jgi:plastocyanin
MQHLFHRPIAEVSRRLPAMSRPQTILAILVACAGATLSRAASLEARVLDASGKGVADAAVYALPAGGRADPRGPRPTVAIEQADREFVPYVTVVEEGTTITFPNRDPIMHHVYSFSPAKSFEIKLYTGKSPSRILFDKPGVVTLGCNIHDWMIAYVLVVPTPYFARTDALGEAVLRDLPAGTYEVHAWHPRERTAAAARTVPLAASAAQRLEFAIDPKPRAVKYKPPLDRSRY